MKTKQQQYNEYLAWGGTMTIEEWEQDGRFDPGPRCPECLELTPQEELDMFGGLCEECYGSND